MKVKFSLDKLGETKKVKIPKNTEISNKNLRSLYVKATLAIEDYSKVL